MIIDMHTHTLYSDGLYSPTKLIDKAIAKNLAGIAITDHDTVEGLDEACRYIKSNEKFVLIPGIEFGCRHDDKEVHLLGYFIDYNHNKLIDITDKLKESRVKRGDEIVKKLMQLGVDISISDVRKYSREGYIGRPHIARALIEKNYVKSIDEAFEKYLKRGRPAFAERFQLTIKESIDLIRDINGISVLAHPKLIGDGSLIDYVISLGIDGIECFHSKHSEDDTKELLKIAKDKNLIITGGSDYHGDDDILGDFYIDFNKTLELKRRLEND